LRCASTLAEVVCRDNDHLLNANGTEKLYMRLPAGLRIGGKLICISGFVRIQGTALSRLFPKVNTDSEDLGGIADLSTLSQVASSIIALHKPRFWNFISSSRWIGKYGSSCSS